MKQLPKTAPIHTTLPRIPQIFTLLVFLGAGMGDVTVMIKDPQGRDNSVEVMMEDKGDNLYRCTYRPTQVGLHSLAVTFGDVAVPKSPFTVDVGPGEDHH